jgi:hypothetical protein
MPHVAELNEQLGVVAIRYWGNLGYAEIAGAFQELVVLPGFRAGLKCVVDFRSAHTSLTGGQIRQLVHVARGTDHAWGTTKWAVIASDDVIFGLSRMYSSLTADHEVTTHVFRSSDAANDWLEIGTSIDDVLHRTLGPTPSAM